MSNSTLTLPTPGDVARAAERLSGLVHRTPVLRSSRLDELSGAQLFFKCENLQRVGAFKFRGAVNAIFGASKDEIERGVITHSSGNHGQAVALASKLKGVKATIVMPRNSSAVKLAAVRGYGAEIVLCDPGTDAREAATRAAAGNNSPLMVHPFDDPLVIAGQGTAALELVTDLPNLDLVITPVGGGGLISGTALALALASPRTILLGAEPAAVDDAARSLHTRTLQASASDAQTIADGLRSTSIGARAFAIILAHVQDIITVSEAEIVVAMRLVWQTLKVIIEPSSATVLAAVLKSPDLCRGRNIGLIITGGNVDLDHLPWVIRRDG